MLPVIGPLRPWTDPSTLQLLRLPAHTPLSGFPRRSLDGDWSFELFDHPDAMPAAALTGRRRRAVTTTVPGNWTMDDTVDDWPQYTNVSMPFPGPPPLLPARNPTGVYRRTVSVPRAWLRDRVVLGVDGAESVHAVYVNGQFAGYGSDSRLPSEYDVSELVVDGVNEVAIVVIRFSAHSYVEDQDQWWMAGLHRPVWIESRPTVHLADLPVATSYDHREATGTIALAASVDFGGSPTRGWQVQATLSDPSGAVVGEVQRVDVDHAHRRAYVFSGFTANLSWDITDAVPWSAEAPHRYTVDVELLDPRGRVVHHETARVGLRTVEIADRQLLVNGRPIWIFGVNRHDHHPDRGKAVTVEDIRDDLVAMRRLNINAIRTSHYPARAELYDLCDELGFYVVDEANIEAHAYNRSLADDERYRATWIDRGARMVQRDRNHPSVIVWSLGNEAGYGTNVDALAGWIRRADPSRPLHYEDAVRVEGWEGGGRPATDIVCPMYPEIDEIRAYGERGVGDRPLIMCEYSHAMGNSNGGLADYWDAILATSGLQGGFVWEWKDHGLRQHLADGTTRLAYGGQFGETIHDGNFVADGLMSAELDPHPATRELAWVHRPVAVRRAAGKVRVENRRAFSGLDDLNAVVVARADGVEIARVAWVPPPIPPLGSTIVDLPPLPDRADSVVVEWSTRDDTWFAPAGHVVAWDQIVEPRRRTSSVGQPAGRPPAELVTPRLSLWRAPTDNDGFKLLPELMRRFGVGGQALARWQDAGLDERDPEDLVDHQLTIREDAASTTFRHTMIVPDELVDLPRVGVTFTLPAGYRTIRWYGRGPHENYPDRNRSAVVAVWESAPDESPYLVPQEFGLRTDCRWVELRSDGDAPTVRIDAVGPSRSFHLSAIRHTADDLYRAATATDLVARDVLVVHLDAAHRGLGTASCGPDVADRSRLAAGRFDLAYRVTLLD